METNDFRFTIDAQSWTSSSLWSPTTTLYSTCGNDYLIGGYKVLGGVGRNSSSGAVKQHWVRRTYTNLPTHTGIVLSFMFVMIDTWNVGDLFFFEFDTVSFNDWSITSINSNLPQVCGGGGSGWGELYIQVYGTLSHTSSTLTFTIYDSSNSYTDNESFGVRDISLLFTTGANSFTNTLCGNASVNIVFGEVCQCPNGQYSTTSPPSAPTCAPCHNNCELCYGSSNTECYKCKPGFSFYGNACSPCSSKCVTCNGNAVNECTSCVAEYTLTPINSCVPVNDCFPLELDIYDTVCKSPCPVGTVLDWEGNCLSTCSSPKTKIQYGVLVCDFPCTTAQYLSWTGSCLDSCPSYYQTVIYKSRNRCNPSCPLDQFYLVKTKECVDACPEGFFANTNTLLCQACLAPLCSSCASLAPQECLVCQQGAIKDSDGVCKSKISF